MYNKLCKEYADALRKYTEARRRLANATLDYDTMRHAARKALYDLKESGQRKLTEEQIRSESMVASAAAYKEYALASFECDVAKEELDAVKTIV